MDDHNKKAIILKRLIEGNRRRRLFLQTTMAYTITRRRRMIKVCLLVLLLLLSQEDSKVYHRSCRRIQRNQGWWDLTWSTYTDERFKKTFRIRKATFEFILSRIRHILERQTVCEEPISPECRLGICLYRLGRGDYFYTIAEMTGLGVSTVCTIVSEVNQAIVGSMWQECVSSHMPETSEDFQGKILDMEELWQFPFSWAAVDGCHIPIKCPPGGQAATKEYHNFKNFYSVVLMALVDAKYKFLWGSCGFPGNSHDSVILQSTDLWSNIKEGNVLPDFTQQEEDVFVPPIILGDSAFPFETWLMKPYTHAVLTQQQRYFNYRLSRARMVIECAYGQLKGRWRVLLRKSESTHFEVKMATLACMVLHNVCLEKGDTIPSKLDLTCDPSTSGRRDRDTIRDILLMKSSPTSPDLGCKEANSVRLAITRKLWQERQEATE